MFAYLCPNLDTIVDFAAHYCERSIHPRYLLAQFADYRPPLAPSHCKPCPPCRPDCPRSLVEFGAGDGSPVISALLKSTKAPGAMPTINAYEIGASAAQLATARAASVGLGDVYRVHNGCFWKGAVQDGKPEDKCLIANPPYIPAPGECEPVRVS